jgi:acetyl-CoA carboxylase/biotin carboxylase 1
MSIDYEEEGGDDDDESPTAVTWRFKLGQSNSPPFTPSVSNLT